MNMNQSIQDLFEAVGEKAAGTGRYDAMLDASTRSLLDHFVEYLRAENKTEATSRSYRSYVAKALAIGGKLSSDQKSAIRAFKDFVQSLDAHDDVESSDEI